MHQVTPSGTHALSPMAGLGPVNGNSSTMTKLARPRLPPSYVDRPTINRLMDADTMAPVTVVTAGPGWGKTLTAAAWAAGVPAVGPVAWLSLDAEDNQRRTFWSGFVAALRAAVPMPAGNPLATLTPGLARETENLRRVTDGLAALPTPVVVVLDEFQVLHDPELLAEIAALLRRPLPQLRLVLLTRSDPSLPLHRLRLTHDLAEIRSQDLAFTVSEATALLAANHVEVSADGVELLVNRTEGWPAGLRLAALFLARQQGSRRQPSDFAGDDQAVVDYLHEEVMAWHSPQIRQFLMRTSIVERVNGGLAEALTGASRGQQHLEALEGSNAFVVGLGPGREWFRYHSLLREMLLHRLTVAQPDQVPELHRRAARWFAEQGEVIEALRHAADAEDWTLFGRLFTTQAAPLTVSAERAALDRVLARVPVRLLWESAELALSAAARLLYAGRFEEMHPYLARATALLADCGAETRSATKVGALMMSAAVLRGRGDIEGLLRTARSVLDELAGPAMALPVASAYRTVALSNLGTGLLWFGRLAEAERHLTQALAEAPGGLDVARVNVLSHLAVVAVSSGRLNEGFDRGTAAVAIVDARGWAPLPQGATAHLALALANVQWNHLDEAQAQLTLGRRAAVLDRAAHTAMELAQVQLDTCLGRLGAARDRMTQLRHDSAGWELPTYLARWLETTEAEIDLAAGDPAAAMARLARLESRDEQGSPYPRAFIGQARAALALGDTATATSILEPLRDADLPAVVTVPVWLLTALIADRDRHDESAQRALARAIDIAAPEGIRRPFVDLGPTQLPRLLLAHRRIEGGRAEFTDQLAADLGLEESTNTEASAPARTLSDRELSILRFLPTMMTNPEIAAELYVSVNTVKAHLKRIYAKLDVSNRRAAVHRARELGLLSGGGYGDRS